MFSPPRVARRARPERLAALLHRYRRLPADALVDDEDRDDLPVIRPPGPRRTTSP
ncbi:hypothetical protein [Streptomyces antimycoticus]|uniref:hypothetical protein n=1 Tax=Streptomyces antimycoticus TaxID=68175 RepID=UPI00382875C4